VVHRLGLAAKPAGFATGGVDRRAAHERTLKHLATPGPTEGDYELPVDLKGTLQAARVALVQPVRVPAQNLRRFPQPLVPSSSAEMSSSVLDAVASPNTITVTTPAPRTAVVITNTPPNPMEP
jgi:hypothetical protein